MLAAFSLLGCGSAESGDRFTVYPVKGRILLANGQPVSQGTVVFVPAPDDPTARQAAGSVASDGTFKLETPYNGQGAAPGNYRIRIESASIAAPSAKPNKQAKFSQKYYEEDTSKLTATVQANSENNVDFILK